MWKMETTSSPTALKLCQLVRVSAQASLRTIVNNNLSTQADTRKERRDRVQWMRTITTHHLILPTPRLLDRVVSTLRHHLSTMTHTLCLLAQRRLLQVPPPPDTSALPHIVTNSNRAVLLTVTPPAERLVSIVRQFDVSVCSLCIPPDHSAVSHQDSYQQNYQQDYRNMADPFAAQPSQTTFSPDAYNASSYMYNAQAQSPPPNSGSNTNPYRGTQAYQQDRAYTLGGGGYGDNVVPALDPSYPQYGNRSPAPTASVYTTSSTTPSAAPPPINTNIRVASPPGMPQPTSPRGPRNPTPSMPAPVVESPAEEYSDSPPMYDAATAQPPGRWGAKQ